MKTVRRIRRGTEADRSTPVPHPIAAALALLGREDFPSREEYDRAVRGVVRRHLVPPGESLWAEGPFREYDGELLGVIREVLEES
jgi:hypothetical protein